MTDYSTMSDLIFECIQCGEEFELVEEEARRLEAKGFDLPKRCPSCRKKKNKTIEDPYSNSRDSRHKRKHHYHKRHHEE